MLVDRRVGLLTTALSNLLVRLQADPLQQLLDLAAQQRQALDTLAGLARQAAYQAWVSAGQEAAGFVALVLKNNPQKPLEEILGRGDVQQAVLIPFEEAASTAKVAIMQAWEGSAALGQQHAADLLGSLGLPSPDSNTPQVLQSLLNDVDENVARARARFIQAMAMDAPAQRMHAVTMDQARRARSSADVAATRGYAEAVEISLMAAMADQGITIRKMWVTRFGPGTCGTCAGLHGTVRDLGQPFPNEAHLGSGSPPPVYGGTLNGPPRHPHCRCRLVPYVAALGGGEVNPATMKQYAAAWIAGTGG